MDEMTGRADLALVRAGEYLVKKKLEPRVGLPLWDAGLNELVSRFVNERLKVPSTPVSMVDVARAVGILPPEPRKRRAR